MDPTKLKALVARMRALTGITTEQIPDQDLEELIAEHDGQVLCAAADAADQMGTRLISGSDVTKVEDITIDVRRTIQEWQGLADRLRKRCFLEEAQKWDDGPGVVEFHPHGYRAGVEGVERAYS